MANLESVFDTIYNQIDFLDIADYLNGLFEVYDIDVNKYIFDATRYGEKLLLRDDYEYIDVPLSYTDDFRPDVSYYFDSFFEEVAHENMSDSDAIDLCMYWWCYTRARYLVEHRTGIELIEKKSAKDKVSSALHLIPM